MLLTVLKAAIAFFLTGCITAFCFVIAIISLDILDMVWKWVVR